MKIGKCEITDGSLYANDVYCHHYIPLHLGGNDKKFAHSLFFLNRDLDVDGAACVVVDATHGGYITTKYLIEQGHSKIGIIVGPPRAYNSI